MLLQGLLLSANRRLAANGIVVVADCDFVGVNCKQVDANNVRLGHEVVVVKLEMLQVLEVAHCCGCTRV